jgi:hypothetical protein
MQFLRGFLLCLLTFVLVTVLGIIVAGRAGAGEGQQLAAAAIVIGYGIMAGFAGVLVALLLLRRFSAKTVMRVNLIGTVLLIFLSVFVTYRYLDRDEAESQPIQPAKPSTRAPAPAQVSFIQSSDSEMGLGYFTPDFYQGGTMYLYGKPTPGKSVVNQLPWDSVVFAVSDMHQYQITYAPPFLNPSHLKMDYEILYFKILSEGHDYVEVLMNDETGRAAYIDKYRGKVIYWPSFILSVNTVELKSEFPQPYRVKPLDHAGELSVDKPYIFLRPESVKGFWLEVSLLNDDFKAEGRAWIRWRDEHNLLVDYSLLS